MNIVLKLDFSKSVEYDNPELGAGYKKDGTKDYSRWWIDLSYLDTVIWAKEGDNIEAKLRKHLEKNGLDLSEFYIFEDGRLSFNTDEDEDGDQLTDTDAKRLNKQLYLCDYDILLTQLPNENSPTEAEMKEIFPSLKIF